MSSIESPHPYPLEQDQIPALSKDFSLGDITSPPTLVNTGIANHNYLVSTDSGEYLVKFLIIETPEGVENDLAIYKQLADSGINSPVYLKDTKGKYIYQTPDLKAVVSRKIDGVIPSVVDVPLCMAIGETLGRFHTAVRDIPHPHKGWLSPDIRLEKNFSDDDELSRQAAALRTEGMQIYSQYLPRGIIHGDFYEENLLVDSGEPNKIVAIFDFEEAEDNLYLVDLARTIIGVCTKDQGTKLDSQLMGSLLGGYSTERELTSGELDNLTLAVKYVAGTGALWLRQLGYTNYAEQFVMRSQSLES